MNFEYKSRNGRFQHTCSVEKPHENETTLRELLKNFKHVDLDDFGLSRSMWFDCEVFTLLDTTVKELMLREEPPNDQMYFTLIKGMPNISFH